MNFILFRTYATNMALIIKLLKATVARAAVLVQFNNNA